MFVVQRRSHGAHGLCPWSSGDEYEVAGEQGEEDEGDAEDEDEKGARIGLSRARASSARDASGRRPVPEVSQKNAMALTSTCISSSEQAVI